MGFKICEGAKKNKMFYSHPTWKDGNWSRIFFFCPVVSQALGNQVLALNDIRSQYLWTVKFIPSDFFKRFVT